MKVENKKILKLSEKWLFKEKKFLESGKIIEKLIEQNPDQYDIEPCDNCKHD